MLLHLSLDISKSDTQLATHGNTATLSTSACSHFLSHILLLSLSPPFFYAAGRLLSLRINKWVCGKAYSSDTKVHLDRGEDCASNVFKIITTFVQSSINGKHSHYNPITNLLRNLKTIRDGPQVAISCQICQNEPRYVFCLLFTDIHIYSQRHRYTVLYYIASRMENLEWKTSKLILGFGPYYVSERLNGVLHCNF
jgi:hypothetical protein